MTKVHFTKIINFMNPGARVHVLECGQSHIVKMRYFVKYLILYTQAWIRQTGYTMSAGWLLVTMDIRCKLLVYWYLLVYNISCFVIGS